MFKLTEEYQTGEVVLDDQHREILARFDSLFRALREEEGTDHLVHTLTYLKDYAARHFRVEEDAMKLHRYPDLLEHLVAHTAFREELEQVGREIERWGASQELAEHISTVLAKLLLVHIREMDRKMATYLRPLVRQWKPL